MVKLTYNCLFLWVTLGKCYWVSLSTRVHFRVTVPLRSVNTHKIHVLYLLTYAICKKLLVSVEEPATAVGLPIKCVPLTSLSKLIESFCYLWRVPSRWTTHGHLYLHLPRQTTGVMSSTWNPTSKDSLKLCCSEHREFSWPWFHAAIKVQLALCLNN